MNPQEYIYLDYAAATPLSPEVLEVMRPHLSDRFANPASLHTPGRQQRAALEEARASVAKALGAKPAEIVFTGGSTEAAYLAIQGLQSPPGKAVALAIEHRAVLAAAASLRQRGWEMETVPVEATGSVDMRRLAEAIDDDTSLVCMQYANNEIGTLQPLAKVAAMVKDIRKQRREHENQRGIYLYCDAAQAGYESLQVSRLGVDMLSMGGGKLYGPPGCGFLYAKTGTPLAPAMPGGGQEGGLRGGTPGVAAAVGLAQALELMQAGREHESRRLQELREELWEGVARAVPDAVRSGGSRHAVPGILNVTIPGIEGEAMVAHLDARGFALATGSACTAAHEDPSHVLLAIGRARDEASSSLRISVGRPTTREQVGRFVSALADTVETLRRLAK